MKTDDELKQEYEKAFDDWHRSGAVMLSAMSNYNDAEQQLLRTIEVRGKLYREMKRIQLALHDGGPR